MMKSQRFFLFRLRFRDRPPSGFANLYGKIEADPPGQPAGPRYMPPDDPVEATERHALLASSGRFAITLSTMPNSFAVSAVRK